MSDASQETRMTGWSPKEVTDLVPWPTASYHFPPEQPYQWIRLPKPSVYTPINLRSSSFNGEPKSKIFETVLYEDKKAIAACSGFLTFRSMGTELRVKQLSLWMQGQERDHDHDTRKFRKVCVQLTKNSTMSAMPVQVHDSILLRDTKTQDSTYNNLEIGASGHGFNFTNFNAASPRETWARQYVFEIFSPDRASLLAAKEPQRRKIFDLASWEIE